MKIKIIIIAVTALMSNILYAAPEQMRLVHGNHLNHRGDRIEHKLDVKGNIINAKYEDLARRAEHNGNIELATRLAEKGKRINAHMNIKGKRLHAKIDAQKRRHHRHHN
jgi:hypothetical protein